MTAPADNGAATQTERPMSEAQITAWLASQHDAMVAMLREMVNIDSGSYNKPGIDAVGAVIRRFMASHNIPIEITPQSRHGRLSACRSPMGRAGRQRGRQHRSDGSSRHRVPGR